MKIDNKKKFMIVGIIILVLTILVCAGTYAWYVWNTSDTEKVNIVTSVGAATIYYDSGSSITDARLRPVSDKSKGIVKEIQIKSSVNNNLKFNLYLDINSIDPSLQHESFRFAIYRGSETTPVKEGNFSSSYLNATGNTDDCTVNTGLKHIQLLNEESISTTITTYTVYIWIDGVNYTNPSEMMNKTFNIKLHADGEDAIIKEGKIPDITTTVENSLAYQLVSTYNNSSKTDVSNNNIVYHYDTTNRLMSDVAGNLRFYGADNTNVSDDLRNYIYFNCSDYSNQSSSTCETWRIIGVFDGKVKIMRNGSIGNLAWDQNKNQNPDLTTYNNDWSNSSLQEFLNGKYYNRGETTTHTYYNGSDGSSSVSINLENIGIKNDKTRGLISDTLWYLRGWKNGTIYSDQMYDYERFSGGVYITTQPKTLFSKIAILYASDFGYAVDFNKCGSSLTKYNATECKNSNWVTTIFEYNKTWWVLSPTSNSRTDVGVVVATGELDYLDNPVYASNRGVVPTLHLNSDASVKSGDGSQDTPYQLSVS